MAVAIYVVLCLVAAFIGRGRVLGFWGYLLLSVVATPVASFAILILGSPRRAQRRARQRARA